jgi:nucleotide-binding universal stress UspA family protein
MYRPTEIETMARRTPIEGVRTGLLSPRTPEVALDCGIGGSNTRLLVVISSGKTEAQCLDFARQFTSEGSAEIHVMKPTSADPADEVRRMAIALEIDWLCMVTHCRPGLMSLFLTSDDERILRAAPCPVVCIPESLGRGREIESTAGALRPVTRILVPINSPLNNRHVLVFAVALAERFGAKIDLLSVEELVQKSADSPEHSFRGARRARSLARKNELATLAEESIPKRLRGRQAVRLGLPLFYAATRTARERQSDLIVLTVPTRRWNAHARIDVGTERILRGAICPVICIPERDVRAGAAPNRELGAALLRDRREAWPRAEWRPERRDPEPIFSRRKRETGVASSIVTINNTNIYDPHETEIACSG